VSDALEAAMDRARSWLARYGSECQQLLAEALLGGDHAHAVEQAFAERQDERGAIAEPEADADDPLETTARALGWLHALGRAEGPVALRAVAFLTAEQRPDGGFGEADEGAGTARTAHVAAVLARMRCVRPSVLTRASGFLAERWSADRLAAGGEAAVSAWFPVLAQLPGPVDDEALQWCGRELEKGVRSGRFDALRTAALFVACDAHALPGARLRADEAAAALVAEQQPDGAWPGGAANTLAALRALRFLAPAVADLPPRAAPC
jgi:hypothetical protein